MAVIARIELGRRLGWVPSPLPVKRPAEIGAPWALASATFDELLERREIVLRATGLDLSGLASPLDLGDLPERFHRLSPIDLLAVCRVVPAVYTDDVEVAALLGALGVEAGGDDACTPSAVVEAAFDRMAADIDVGWRSRPGAGTSPAFGRLEAVSLMGDRSFGRHRRFDLWEWIALRLGRVGDHKRRWFG